MRPLVLYGAGGLGREVALLVRAMNREQQVYSLLGFVDDGATSGSVGVALLGGFEALEVAAAEHSDLAVAISIGGIEALELLAGRIDAKLPGVEIVNLAHPDASLDWESIEAGRGNIIGAGARLANVRMGSLNVINMNTVLGHDVRIGDFNLIHPGALLNGEVEVGSRVTIGAGAVVIPRVSIGDGATVAIGAVVGRSVGDREIVAGNPARVVGRAR